MYLKQVANAALAPPELQLGYSVTAVRKSLL